MFTGQDLTVIVPMLGRAHHVEPLLANILDTVPDAQVLFCVTDNDNAVIHEMNRLHAEHIFVQKRSFGDYARKINQGLEATSRELVFLGADDLKFHQGWFEAALSVLTPGVGVIGTNDLGSPRVMAGEHSTHSLVTRTYAVRYGTIDEPGKILHEGYTHEFVDDELVGTAKFRKAWAFAVDAKVEHMHPNWGKAPKDHLYALQRRRMIGPRGQRLFLTRERMWTLR